MLTHVLHQHLDQPWVEQWLRRQLPARYRAVEVDLDGALRFTFTKVEHDPVVWDSGRCLKLMQRSAPTVAALLLYRLCWFYDTRQETSKVLSRALLKLLGCRGETALWYWSEQTGGLLTTIALKGRRRKTDDVKILRRSPLDEDAFYVVLPPSGWLCDVLLQHLVRLAA